MSLSLHVNRRPTDQRLYEVRSDRARQPDPVMDREYIVPVLLKSIQIIELLAKSPDGLRIDEIQRRTKIARSTVYRVVRTLAVCGHLTHRGNGAYAVVATDRTGSRPLLVSPQLGDGPSALRDPLPNFA